MHLRDIALLVSAAFLISAASLGPVHPVLTASDLEFPVNPFPADTNEVAVKRALRWRAVETVDDEERGFSLKAWFSSSGPSEKQLQKWLNKQKSADDVFKSLKLTNAGDKLLQNPKFVVWLDYVEALGKISADKGAAAIPALAARYGNKELSQMIIAAKAVPSTESVATRLQTQLVRSWFAKRKPQGDVFKWLLLDEAGAGLLESKQFSLWLNYVTKSVPETSRSKAILTTLTNSYGDARLAELLISAKAVSSTAATAKTMQNWQVQRWADSKKPASDVFKWLMLDKAGEKVLESPEFLRWYKYVDNAFENGPEEAILVLIHRYRDDLSRVLIQAKTVPGTKKLAHTLQVELLYH
jgi:hypothetical protein